MPNYNTLASIPINAIYPGDQIFLFNAEQPAAPQASVQVALANVYDNTNAEGASVEIFFSAAPGAFELDIQVADTDTDAAYITVPGGIFTTVNANNFARIELVPVKAKLLRVRLVSRTNNVNLTVKVTR
jgi:hypothetical protein